MRGVWMGSGLATLMMGLTLVLAPGAGAVDLSLPVGTVVYAESGSLVELGRVPVDASLAGSLCTWEATVTNQNSVHSGNDILIRSGDAELVLSEVEATEGKVTSSAGSVWVAEEVIVTLRMGPDGVFSGGLDLTIRYDRCTPPTTAVPTTTVPTTTVPTTTVPTTTVPTTTVPTSMSVVPAPTTVLETTTSTDGPPEPLGPTVTTTPATTALGTTIEVEPAGPVLPVTGAAGSRSLVLGGIAMIGLGSIGVVTTRRAVR